MKIAIVSIGTRGDVQPCLVLGLALRSRGHEVVMATEARLRPLVEEMARASSSSSAVPRDGDDHGVEAAPPLTWRLIEGDETGIIDQPGIQEILADGKVMKMMKASAEWKKKFDATAIMKSYISALEGADVVIAGPLCLTIAMCVAEKMGCGFVTLIPGPTLPTSEFPIWLLPVPCTCLNRWTYRVLFDALWRQERKKINEFRKMELSLPPMSTGPLATLEKYGFPCIVASSSVACGPKMVVPSDYPHYAIVGGFIFPPDDAIDLDERLVDFVESSPSSSSAKTPIVYLGWGSMPAPDPVRLIELARGLCDAASCRGVLVAGWSDLFDPTNERCARAIEIASEGGVLLVIKSVRHSWLLPRCAALAHHCGIGTCAAALRAGVPQIACPVMVDQPHNARVMNRLGVVAGIVPFGKLSVERLLPPLRRILDEGGNGPLCDAARNMADRIGKESEGNLDKYADAVEGAARFPAPSGI
jgi:hypothetical protein